MKNPSLLWVALLGGVGWLAAAMPCPAGEKPTSKLISTAPSGAFSLEVDQDGGPLWLVPAHNPGARVALPTTRVLVLKPTAPGERDKKPEWIEVATDQLKWPPLAFISPDDRWIFVMQNTNMEENAHAFDYDPTTMGYLYHRVKDTPDAAPRYELAAPQRFDIQAYLYLAQEEKFVVEHVGELHEKGFFKESVVFAGWSDDSARLMVALNCGVYVGGEYVLVKQWLCYFNTRTGAFERTERLRATDRVVMTVALTENTVAEVLHAESIGQEGPIVLAKDRFAQADTSSNALYGQLLKRLAPAAQAQLRQEERGWIDERDTFAAVHANESWSPFAEASVLEWQAIFTEMRAAELRRRIEPGGKTISDPKRSEVGNR